MATKNAPGLDTRTIDDFKSKLVGGGARPNLFEVELVFPQGLAEQAAEERGRFLVKAANLPASNINVIDVPFRGRNLKIAGDRTFDSWTVTVINDTDFAIRSSMENWMNGINNVADNTGLVTPSDYQASAFVHQLDRDGSVLRSYRFHGVFPTQVAPIELSYDAQGIQEFTVEFQVQYWTAFKGDGDNAGGEDIVGAGGVA